MSKTKFQHLVKNVPNTEKNRAFIKKINKMSKQSESCYKLYIRYRKPKEGFSFGYGGNLKCENANAFSVYIQDRRPYAEQPMSQVYSRHDEIERKLNKKIALLEMNVEALEKEISIYRNPYYNWNFSELEEKLEEIKEKMVTRCLEVVEPYSYNISGLRDEYLLINEVLIQKEKELRRDRV